MSSGLYKGSTTTATGAAVIADLSKTLAELIGGKRGWTYQNGVKPGAQKLGQFQECLKLRGVPAVGSQEGKGSETIAHVKIFDPCGSWTWYLCEWDGKLEAYGLVDGHEKELGYVNLAELATERGRMGIGMELDMHWKPRTLKACGAPDYD